MTTPAQRRFESVLAAGRGTDAPIDSRAQNQYELMLMQLSEHRRALKKVQSLERKLETKTNFLPEYEAYIKGTLKGGKGSQDEVFVTIMLWHIDVGNIEHALTLAEYALKHDLVMPDRFDRGLACAIVEEIAETAGRLFESEQAVPSKVLGQLVVMTAQHDMYDQARSKLFRQLGQALEHEGQDEKAIEAYKQALTLNAKIGVKKVMDKLIAKLKKAEADKNKTTTKAPETKDESVPSESSTEQSEQETDNSEQTSESDAG